MKLISWNVNGLRACVKKGFLDYFKSEDADIFCLQETKLQEGQIDLDLEGYHQYWNYAEKKGYSGTAIFTKKEPLNVYYGINMEHHDKEGRVITLEFEDFFMVTVYTPNSQSELARLEYRMEWEDDFRNYLLELSSKKGVVVCGDLNVAHKEIDLKNPTFRYFNPDLEGIYSWWSYRFNARKNNAGWRIDYFLVSNNLEDRIKEASIDTEILGSDHCPVKLIME